VTGYPFLAPERASRGRTPVRRGLGGVWWYTGSQRLSERRLVGEAGRSPGVVPRVAGRRRGLAPPGLADRRCGVAGGRADRVDQQRDSGPILAGLAVLPLLGFQAAGDDHLVPTPVGLDGVLRRFTEDRSPNEQH